MNQTIGSLIHVADGETPALVCPIHPLCSHKSEVSSPFVSPRQHHFHLCLTLSFFLFHLLSNIIVLLWLRLRQQLRQRPWLSLPVIKTALISAVKELFLNVNLDLIFANFIVQVLKIYSLELTWDIVKDNFKFIYNTLKIWNGQRCIYQKWDRWKKQHTCLSAFYCRGNQLNHSPVNAIAGLCRIHCTMALRI